MESLWRDLRFGGRTLLRDPGFTVAVLFTLGLGLGAASAIYSVADAVLLTPLPYEAPHRLLRITSGHREDGEVKEWPLSYLDFEDLRERQNSFEALAVHSNARSFNLSLAAEAVQVEGEFVSAGYFQALGEKSLLGRTFAPEEDHRGSPRLVAVLSHALWQSRFGGDPAVLERTLLLNEEPYDILGVMPPRFQGVTDQAKIWVPVTAAARVLGEHYIESRSLRWLSAIGRLNSGVGIQQARDEMIALAAGLEEEYADINRDVTVRVLPLEEETFGPLRPAVSILLACAGFVLLLICANLANLQLARSAARGREIAVRRALGAGRGQVVRQLVAESLLLAVGGGILGLGVAHWGTGLLIFSSGVEVPSFLAVGLDARVLTVTMAVALCCGLGFGLAPALLVASRDPGSTLQRLGRSGVEVGRQRFQNTLVVAQVALALVLVAGAGLMASALEHRVRTDLGFDSKELLTAKMDLKGPSLAPPEAKVALMETLLERLHAVAAVGEIALEGPSMPVGHWSGAYFTVEEHRGQGSDDLVVLPFHLVSPGYFKVLGIPFEDGTDFEGQDRQGTPLAVIVSRAAAERYWPGEDPLGKRLKFGGRDSEEPWATVRGVVADVRHTGRRGDGRPPTDVYFTVRQFPPTTPPTLNLLVRPQGLSAAGLTSVLREEVQSIAPHIPLYDLATIEERLHNQVARERFSAGLMALFAALALLLAILGIYGVLAYTVTQRQRELGIRLALGAEAPHLVHRLVVRGGRLAVVGVVLGMLGILGLAKVAGSLLEGVLGEVSSTDPLVLAAAASLLLAVALLASWVPARRVARVEPTEVLRAE